MCLVNLQICNKIVVYKYVTLLISILKNRKEKWMIILLAKEKYKEYTHGYLQQEEKPSPSWAIIFTNNCLLRTSRRVQRCFYFNILPTNVFLEEIYQSHWLLRGEREKLSYHLSFFFFCPASKIKEKPLHSGCFLFRIGGKQKYHGHRHLQFTKAFVPNYTFICQILQWNKVLFSFCRKGQQLLGVGVACPRSQMQVMWITSRSSDSQLSAISRPQN